MISRTISQALRTTPLRRPPSLHSPNPLRLVRLKPQLAPSCSRSRPASTITSAKQLFRENPFSLSLASFFVLLGAGFLIYTNYVYNTYIAQVNTRFPEPVAGKLRRALFFTNQDLQPDKALAYYRQALAAAAQVGMDPFSDEILGVKFKVSALMEKIGQIPKAIEVLEAVQRDCLEWIDAYNNAGAAPDQAGKRTRVLGKTVGLAVKLGELYASDAIQDQDAAEAKLVWAVETVLKEERRRAEQGVKEGEGRWMTSEESGAALESLATHYEEKDHHYLAAPLYLHALGLAAPKSCHAVVLMNNLSISLGQQPADPASRTTIIASARAWAEQALALSASIQPPLRNEECDTGCAVATHNLGEFAEMERDLAEARRRYEEAKGLSRGLGFKEGVRRADEGLRRVRAGG